VRGPESEEKKTTSASKRKRHESKMEKENFHISTAQNSDVEMERERTGAV
jgi:hypothetical protein